MRLRELPLRPISVDFEYIPRDDGTLTVVCVVAKDLWTGEVYQAFGDELGPRPPFPTGPGTVMVAYNSAAEIEAFNNLGWERPRHILDLFAEHLRLVNGLPPSQLNGVTGPRGSLLAALRIHGLPARETETKRSVINRILAGPPYDDADRRRILDYCREDVDDAGDLLEVILPKMGSAWLLGALIRGDYSEAIAAFNANGYPVNADLHDQIVASWDAIRGGIRDSVRGFGVYEGNAFNMARLGDLIEAIGAKDEWPQTPNGQWSTAEKTWRGMSQRFPAIEKLATAQISLTQMKKIQPLAIGPDGRARVGKRDLAFRRVGLEAAPEDLRSVGWGAYRSKTGRNQPGSKEFLYLRASWWRQLVTPPPGRALIYADWKTQEIAVAAYRSNDPHMIADYKAADYYLSFAKEAGLVPETATKETHEDYRQKILKAVCLGTLYGMTEVGLAARINRSIAEAAHLYQSHRSRYRVFWDWIGRTLEAVTLAGEIETPLGWKMAVADERQSFWVGDTWETEGVSPTTLQNWPIQATAGDILRVAAIAITRAGIRMCFPLHDAIMVECDVAEVEDVKEIVNDLMVRAAVAVIGHPIPVDFDVLLPGETHLSGKGAAMWSIVSKELKAQNRKAA